MAHHGDTELSDSLKNMKFGATGKFPEGKLNQYDCGELVMMVGIENGKVILAFGKHINWIGFNTKQAKELGQMLIDKAVQIENNRS